MAARPSRRYDAAPLAESEARTFVEINHYAGTYPAARLRFGLYSTTGLTIAEHQVRTVANYPEMRSLAPDLPFVPVLQGWIRDDYLRCVDLYQRASINLAAEPLVGVGSVCRRQATGEIEVIVHSLASLGMRLHGFGVKAGGFIRYADCLASADSLAWELRGAAVAAADRLPARQLCELPALRGSVEGADAGAGRRGAAALAAGCVGRTAWADADASRSWHWSDGLNC